MLYAVRSVLCAVCCVVLHSNTGISLLLPLLLPLLFLSFFLSFFLRYACAAFTAGFLCVWNVVSVLVEYVL